MADTEKKISELDSAAQINTDDITVLSQGNSGTGFASVKATILAIANKIVSGINFTSALQTTDKTITGAINEVAQGGGGGGASELDDLDDVSISSPTNGQVLKYNSTSQEWENANESGGGSGGHTIKNDSGTSLTQRDNLQFGGVYTHDDSTNNKTKVDIVREFSTVAEIEALTGEAQKGFQVVQDAEDYIPFTASENIFDNTNTSFTGDNVQDVLEEVDDSLNKYSNTSQTMTGISVALARKGQLKYLRFSDNGTSSALNSGELLGTISNALYRPSAVLDIRDTYSNMRFTIETDGTIVARQNISSGTIIRGSFMYF